jgi:hypothetical protein
MAQEQVQSPFPWQNALAMGTIQAHRCAPLSPANPLQKLPGALEARAILLAFVAAQSLLQATPLVLGKSVSQGWPAPLPLANLQAFRWCALA